jgi:hypothetical protein
VPTVRGDIEFPDRIEMKISRRRITVVIALLGHQGRSRARDREAP